MSPIFLVITTESTQEQANALASEAITLGLAACAQVQAPCQSAYSWKGKIESALEYPIHFKTNELRHQALREFIDEKHSYDVPEIVSVQIDTANPAYVAWIQQSLGE